jgi:hypothetical protein
MTHFEFRSEHNNDENYQTFVSFEAETLDEVLANFTLFLRGAGYYVDEITYDMSSGIMKPSTTLTAENLKDTMGW